MIFICILIAISHVALFYLGCLHGLKIAQQRCDKATMFLGERLALLDVRQPFTTAAEIVADFRESME